MAEQLSHPHVLFGVYARVSVNRALTVHSQFSTALFAVNAFHSLQFSTFNSGYFSVFANKNGKQTTVELERFYELDGIASESFKSFGMHKNLNEVR